MVHTWSKHGPNTVQTRYKTRSIRGTNMVHGAKVGSQDGTLHGTNTVPIWFKYGPNMV